MTQQIQEMQLKDLEWRVSAGLTPYPSAQQAMEERVAAIHAGTAPELVWLLEHPPLYTAGTNANNADLLHARFPVYPTGRGGKHTYHGPGQRVAYVMLDLTKHHQGQPDLHHYVNQLEEWVLLALADLGVAAERRDDSADRRVGLWVKNNGREEKIAAIGVRVRHWVSFHGVAINVNPDLSHFNGIIPCGIKEHGVTSLAALGKKADMTALDAALHHNWPKVFV